MLSSQLSRQLARFLRTSPSCARVPHRSVLAVTGLDAVPFLNGILAATVRSPVNGGSYSVLLTAQGKILYDLFLYPFQGSKQQDAFYVDCDSRPSKGPPLQSLLKRYILRSRVRVRDVSAELGVWAAWDPPKRPDSLHTDYQPPREWSITASSCIHPVWKADDRPWGSEPLRILDQRASGMGTRFLVPNGQYPSETQTHDLISSDEYDIHRMLHGVPEGILELQPENGFPMESNMDIMDGVNFHKGCYVGQELTVRVYHTGSVRKRILPVLLHGPRTASETLKDSAVPLVYPDSVIKPIPTESGSFQPRPRGSGKLLSTTRNIGLSLMRLEQFKAYLGGHLRFQVANADQEPLEVHPWWPEDRPNWETSQKNTSMG